ncbi:membrane protein [Erythrobacter sp. Dej080120_24]|uniref:ribosomal maturation YjgA family protein n=1 Tax=unclassified Erythrobacter TaxID=2633097 RepID=UPI00291FA7F8|nr:membrane protein [Erythrobacter sp. Dej080120_24]
MRLDRGYAFAAAGLLLVEIVIALFVRDNFVRPVLGDVLAVMLVYCAVLAIVDLPRILAAVFAFLEGVVIEAMQYLDALTALGLQHNPVARVVLGTTFSWGDIVAYAAGVILALVADRAWRKRHRAITQP